MQNWLGQKLSFSDQLRNSFWGNSQNREHPTDSSRPNQYISFIFVYQGTSNTKTCLSQGTRAASVTTPEVYCEPNEEARIQVESSYYSPQSKEQNPQQAEQGQAQIQQCV